MNQHACVTLATACTLLFVVATRVSAQERLVRQRVAGTSATYESISFGGDGLLQTGFAGIDTTRIAGVEQFSVPVTFGTPIGAAWRVDVTALYASGTVRYREKNATRTRSATLSGISDVRARATGSIIADRLFLTIGANIPTGRTSLTGMEFSVLRILAAPALGMGSSPVGAGASGTIGLVYARSIAGWEMAAGASYEHRGTFQPVAAFSAGAPSADFKPGAVVRASLSADRIIGGHRLFLALTSDRFASDRLTGVPAATAPVGELATVRLGPVYSADAQLQFAVRSLREFLVFSSYRWRSEYQREGETVPGSSGYYLDIGSRAAFPLRAQTSLVVALDGRVHSGLGVDQGLPTSGVASAASTVALDVRHGGLSLQPFVRVQAGSLEQRGAVASGTKTFRGAGLGMSVVTRF